MRRKTGGAHRLEADERMGIELSRDRDDEPRGVWFARAANSLGIGIGIKNRQPRDVPRTLISPLARTFTLTAFPLPSYLNTYARCSKRH